MGDIGQRALQSLAFSLPFPLGDRDTLVVDAMEDAVGRIVTDVARCVADAARAPSPIPCPVT